MSERARSSVSASVLPELGSVIVIAKRPEPGRVKTRLTPPLTPEQACGLAAAALTDTLAAAAQVSASEHILAFSEAPRSWLPDGWRAVLQPAGGLDVRLAAAFDEAGVEPAVLVGMDTPQARAEQIAAFDPSRYDACLGMAVDGGYWAIGFRDPRTARKVIPGVLMSTERTGLDQLERMTAAGLRVQMLDVLVDVDTIEAARTVAAHAPSTSFASVFRQTLVGA